MGKKKDARRLEEIRLIVLDAVDRATDLKEDYEYQIAENTRLRMRIRHLEERVAVLTRPPTWAEIFMAQLEMSAPDYAEFIEVNEWGYGVGEATEG